MLSLEEALRTALDDEYRARATYRAILDRFGEVRPFSNIVASEQRHIEALLGLFERHGFEVPEDAWSSRVEAPASLADACAAAVAGERENAALYDRLLAAAEGHADVERVFRNLLSASQENHLPAFERALARETGEGGGGSGRGGTGGRRHRHRGGRGGSAG